MQKSLHGLKNHIFLKIMLAKIAFLPGLFAMQNNMQRPHGDFFAVYVLSLSDAACPYVYLEKSIFMHYN